MVGEREDMSISSSRFRFIAVLLSILAAISMASVLSACSEGKSDVTVERAELECTTVDANAVSDGEPADESDTGKTRDPRSLDDAVIGDVPGQIYRGEPVVPALSISLDGDELSEGTDYAIDFEGNDGAGKAKATITGMGDYSGTRTIEFDILPEKEDVLVVSDIHYTETGSEFYYKHGKKKTHRKPKALTKLAGTLDYWKGAPNLVESPAAIINVGDTADLGHKYEFENVRDTIENCYPGAEQLTVLGNHDACWRDSWEDDYTEEEKAAYTQEYTPRDLQYFLDVYGTTNPYVETTYANIMGIGEPCHEEAGYRIITDENLELLRERLDKTQEQGKWAVVVCHYALSSRMYDVQLEPLWELMKEYPNVVYVSGHLHGRNIVKKDGDDNIISDWRVRDLRDDEDYGFIYTISKSVYYDHAESRLFTFESDGTLTIKSHETKEGRELTTLGIFEKR